MSTMLDWLEQAFKVDRAGSSGGRHGRSKSIKVNSIEVRVLSSTLTKITGALPAYDLSINLDLSTLANDGFVIVEPVCTCPDWKQSGGREMGRLCKHLIAFACALDTETHAPGTQMSKPKRKVGEVARFAPGQEDTADTAPFSERISRAISDAIERLATQVVSVLEAGYVPLLVGPTGCGKTSAVRRAAQRMGCRLVEHAGSDSWSDSDLVGVEMPNGRRFPGPVAQALTHARELEEPVLLFLDEFTRYNSRAQEANMRTFLPTDPQTVASLGLPHHGAVRITSAPFWGDEWAPASLVHIVAACNPWGVAIDPALARRTVPLFVSFDDSVRGMFSASLGAAIDLSWKGVSDGSLPLPLEYGELSRAAQPDDSEVIGRYINRLRVVDASASQAFASLLTGVKRR